MKPLERLAAIQERALERLREGSADRDFLVQLLENSCLLELAKLDSKQDLATNVQAAVEVICAMFPVDGCAVVFDTDDGRPWIVASGEEAADESARYRADIVINGLRAGELRLGKLNANLDARRFTQAAATQLALCFANSIEAESLRRSAATATASRLAAELDDDGAVDTIGAIVQQLAAFPGAVAAELLVDHPALGPPLTVTAGNPGEVKPVVVSRAIPGTGVLAARLSMRQGSPPPDGAIGEVLDRIVGSLERISREQRLLREVETDPLTGLGNRRRLDHALEVAISRARRYGEHVTMLLVDFDGFKAVNDTLGHEAGDLVLQSAAAAARRVTRGYDEVVRLGGDEFVVLSSSTELFGALALAESLRTSISESASGVLPADRSITVSIGIALYPDSALDADALMRAADAALYESKAAGKNCVSVAPVAGLEPAEATEFVPNQERTGVVIDGVAAFAGRQRKRGSWRRQNS